MVDPQEELYGATFSVEGEDHTLANSLRFFLNKNPNVSFCGYSIPHPSEDAVNIRVQTSGEVTASQALRTACEDLKDVCLHIQEVFNSALIAQNMDGVVAMDTGKQQQ